MSELLPYMLGELQARGWDHTRQPLIGLPQAFRFGAALCPSASDVAAQTAAYCAAGAFAIIFHAWNDSYPGAKAQLFNAPDLRHGAAAGLDQCRALWSGH